MAEPGEEVNAHKGEDNYQTLFNNGKLTFDAMLAGILEVNKRSSDVGLQVNTVALQALQNAVETANMVGKSAAQNMDAAAKQGLNSAALAVDKQWNLNVPEGAAQSEVLKAGGMNSATIAAIQAVMASALSDAQAAAAAAAEEE